MKKHVLILIFFAAHNLNAQDAVLRILKINFLVNKRFEFQSGDDFEYKLKGQYHFHKSRIISLHDSTIELEENKIIYLRNLKCIKANTSNYVKSSFRKFFLRGAFLFLVLDAGNNLIFGNPEVVNPKALYVSGGLFAAGLLMRRTEYRKIRINRNKIVSIIDRSYQNLNPKTN